MIRFDEFELDLERFELRQLGEPIHVEPLVFELLRFLAENPGRVIARDDVIEAVWDGRVVSDATVSSAIKAARKALGDSGRTQKYIRTVRGRGVEFLAETATASPAEEPPPASPPPPPAVASAPPPAAAAEPPPAAAAEPPPLARDETALLTRPKDPRPSMVVLPFAMDAPHTAHPVLPEAFAFDIIRAMSRLRWIRIIARGTAFRFRSGEARLEEVREAIDARYCLTGSIATMGEGLFITFELIDLIDMSEVWSDHLEGRLDEIHGLREDVIQRVIACIETQIPAHEGRLAQLVAPESLDAWSAYHLGLVNMYRFNEPGIASAVDLFGRAIELDPTFARAHAGLSFAQYQNAFNEYSGISKEAATKAAFASATRALELDPYDPFCNFTQGRTLWLTGEWEESLPWFRRATETSPSFAQGHYATAFVSALTADTANAHRAAEIATSLSPLDPFLWGFKLARAFAYIADGDYAEAREQANQAAMEPGALVVVDMTATIANHLAGEQEEARRWAARAKSRKPDANVDHYFQALRFQDPAIRELMTAALRKHGF